MRTYSIDPDIIPPVYLPLLLDNTRYIVLYGGRGSAKTSFAIRKYLLRAFKNEYFKCVYVRKAAAHIRDSLYAGFKSAAIDLDIYDFFKWYDSDYRIIGKNGNSFIPKGVDDPELTKGVDEVSHLLIEEITELSFEDFTTLNALLRTNKTQLQTMCMFNPIQDTHWLRTHFFDPNDRHLPNPAFGEQLKILRTTYKDNNFINRQAYYDTLLLNAAGNTNRIKVDVEGDWGVPENNNPWLYAFDHKKHVQPLQFLPTYPIYLSFDFNRDPVTASAWQMSPDAINGQGFVHCIKEFALKMQLKDLCERIKATYPNSILFVTGDRTGKNGNVGFEDRHATFYTMIQKYLRLTPRQMDIEGKNMEHNDSRQLVNTVLYNHPNVKICPVGCPKLIEECQLATVDETKQKAGVLKKDRDLYKMDLFDGFRYFWQTYFEAYANKVSLHK